MKISTLRNRRTGKKGVMNLFIYFSIPDLPFGLVHPKDYFMFYKMLSQWGINFSRLSEQSKFCY